MTKEDEIIQFLDEHIFNPILDSKTASISLKQGARLTRSRMLQRSSKGMVSYYWSAIVGTEKSIGFAKKLKQENFIRFEEVIDEFRNKFSDEWLRK
ncbi:MAG: hypothetical protein AB9834_09995 [Lentimicrobium sp.]